MYEKSKYDWQDLRLWRVVGLVSLILFPIWPLGMVVLRELYDVPIQAAWALCLPLFVVGAAARKITTFECPECRRPFSSHDQTGTQLTNKRCAHCGLAMGT